MRYNAVGHRPRQMDAEARLPTEAQPTRGASSQTANLVAGLLMPIFRSKAAITAVALLSFLISACSSSAAPQPAVLPTPTVDYTADRFFATAEPACQKYWIWIDYSDLVQGNDDGRLCGNWLPWAREQVIALSACWEALPVPVAECTAEYYSGSWNYVRILRDIVEQVDSYCYRGGDLGKALDLVKIADRILEDREFSVRDCYDRRW